MSMKVQLEDGATMPTKNPTDVGWDLTFTKRIKVVEIPKAVDENGYQVNVVKRLEYYTTGVRVQPPPGYYTTLHPRSSFPKTGYMLANNTGIIDPPYTGELIACLIKMYPTVPDLPLKDDDGNPIRYMQLVLHKFETCELEQVDELEKTARGDGGFGSTGQA